MEEHKNMFNWANYREAEILAELKESEHPNHPILAKVPLGAGSFP